MKLTVNLKSYKIRWVCNAVRLSKRGKSVISLAFCEKTKRVAFAETNMFDSLIVHNISVTKNGNGVKRCEEAQWCWDLECPLNKATPSQFKRYLGKDYDMDTFKQVARKIQELGKHFIGEIDWDGKGHIYYEKPPVWIRKTRKPSKSRPRGFQRKGGTENEVH